ncbi:MAG: hypothetical protein GXP45_02650 [bacterium]|nr:hypothetical protein [bacterium]
MKNDAHVKNLINKDPKQYGNAILILARLANGFVETLNKLIKKAEKDNNEKAILNLELIVNWDKCEIDKSKAKR